MTLAALIAAYHEADDAGGGLRATLPIAGRTLVERQVRLAAAAGAEPVVVVVERVTAALGAALDRLRAEGVILVLARNAEEAAEAVHSNDLVLLVGDGLVAPEAAIAQLASQRARPIRSACRVALSMKAARSSRISSGSLPTAAAREAFRAPGS